MRGAKGTVARQGGGGAGGGCAASLGKRGSYWRNNFIVYFPYKWGRDEK